MADGARPAAAAAAAVPRVLPKSSWVNDKDVPVCQSPNCIVTFSTVKRRHHCRFCGRIFCEKCSRWRMTSQRACFRCYSKGAAAIRGGAAGPFETFFSASGVSPDGAITRVVTDCGGAAAAPAELSVPKGTAVRIRVWVDPQWVVATSLDPETQDKTGLVPVVFLARTDPVLHLLRLCGSRAEPMQSIDKLVERSVAEDDGGSRLVVVQVGNSANHELELATAPGDIVSLHRWVDANWLVATARNGEVGIIPAAALAPAPALVLPRTDLVADDVS